eukprot:Rhum_TRINITY_DN13870_c0_g1::Rhum_TRINITY_DN13870_c0_g1_i5::g.65230::m.65230/K16458/CEP104; centrosomal protein CEP104
MPRRIGFDVAVCSGEDESHPASELQQHTSDTKGWQSPKFSEYPQELVLRFRGDTFVEQIQFLSDACKVATRIEVFIGEPTRQSSGQLRYYEPDTAAWKRLGYLSLSSNENSDYIARELKTVHVNCTALYLRLLFHQCHINAYNYYNQVGLVALNVIGKTGEPYHQTPTAYQLAAGIPPSGDMGEVEVDLKDMKPPEAATGAAQDTRYSLHFDPITQKKIRDLTIIKQRAVQEEDYDTAKRMKDQIEKLKEIGSQLLLLENQKKQAVSQEDYDLAKSLKQEIDELRRHALSAARANTPPVAPPPVCLPPMSGTPSNPNLSFQQQRGTNPLPPLQQTQPAATAVPEVVIEPTPPEPAQAPTPPAPPAPRQAEPAAADLSNVPFDERPAVSHTYQTVAPEEPDEGDENAHSQKWWDVDKALHSENPFNTQVPLGGAARGAEAAPGSKTPATEWEADLRDRIVAQFSEAVGVEVMSEAKHRAVADLLTVFGDFATSCLFSKKWQNRDAAVRGVAGKVSAGGGDSSPFPDVAVRTAALLKHLSAKGQGLNDPVAGVVSASTEVIRMMLESSAKFDTQCKDALGHIAPVLVVKAADSNQRTRELAKELLMMLAVHQAYGAERVCSCVLSDESEHPGKKHKTNLWRPLQAKCVLTSLILDKFGLKGLRNVLHVDAIMDKLGLPAVNHANPEAREAGIHLIAQLNCMGAERQVHRHLSGMKKALLDLIEKATENMKSPPSHMLAPHEKELMNSSTSIDGDEGVCDVPVSAISARPSPAPTGEAADPRGPSSNVAGVGGSPRATRR